MKSIEEIIELQKKQDCIKANKLTLKSSLAFNPYVREIVIKFYTLTKSQSGKGKSSISPSKVIYSRRK